MKYLNENDQIFVQGSGKKPYLIRKIGGVVDCSCPAWRNLGGPISNRVCKHIKANVDPKCLLPEAQSVISGKSKTEDVTKPIKLTKTGKISTAIGGVVVKDTAPPILLAHKLEDEDPTNYWMSEKLDGVRAWWDGKNFISRLGNTYHAPDWFKAGLPDIPLDGELWIGRKQFQKTVSAVRKLIPDDKEWAEVKYLVFDLPTLKEPFESRIDKLGKVWKDHFHQEICYWEPVSFTKVANLKHLKDELKKVEAIGAEGLMLRAPNSMYEEGRSKTLLKVKSFFDAEAEVIAYQDGRGKHKGRMGGVVVRMDNGKEFVIGSGFSDYERENPPNLGEKITYRYQELNEGGIPRFAVFVSVRDYE